MAKVQIGHAISASKPAAQQVSVTDYYFDKSDPWILVLRPKRASVAEKSADICQAVCDNDHILPCTSYNEATGTYNDRGELIYTIMAECDLEGEEYNWYSELPKVTVDNIKTLEKDCYIDDTSLMSFCAYCGGADMTLYCSNELAHDGVPNPHLGAGSPDLACMPAHFTSNKDYIKKTSSKYTQGSEYLRRGDILVSAKHTAMVLTDGSNTGSDASRYKIDVAISNVKATSITVNLNTMQVKDSEETLLSDDDIKGYTWQYSLAKIGSEVKTATVKVKKASTSFNITGLETNTPYSLLVEAEKGLLTISSSYVVFVTAEALPSAISNLSVSLNETSKELYITFTNPASWGDSSLTKRYILNILIDGKIACSSSTVLSVGTGTIRNKKVKFSSLTSDNSVFANDNLIQVGIQTALEKADGTLCFDPSALRCTDVILIPNTLKKIARCFININKTAFKRLIIHHKQEV